jgi:hypothetical protein
MRALDGEREELRSIKVKMLSSDILHSRQINRNQYPLS